MRSAKYFHLLSPAPLDLPEIANNIRSYLSHYDLRKCLLVCTTWKHRFAPFLWETLYCNQHLIENDLLLSSYGHYVRVLFTYSLRDKALAKIAKFCPNLTALELEIEGPCDPASLVALYLSCNRLEKLSIRPCDTLELGSIQRGPLLPLTMSVLTQLKELRLRGQGNRRYALYQTRMILRCLEGCPLLQLLELSSVRLVDTAAELHEASQTSFSSPNSVKPPAIHQDTLPGLSWLPWNKRSNHRSHTIMTASVTSSDLRHDPPGTDAMTTPDLVYQNTHLRTLILSNINTNTSSQTGVRFTSSLLQRAPNLTHISVALAPIDIEDLAYLCPKLKCVSFDNGAGQVLPFPTPHIGTYLGSPLGSLMSLRTLQLVRCSLDPAFLDSIQNEFKQHGLRHLEISQCTGLDTLALASFLGQCRALETVTLDSFLEKIHPSNMLVPREPSEISRPQGTHPRSIRWDCDQIRYLDVFGKTGDRATFEHVFLDLVPRLAQLEFLGIHVTHVGWLMEMEPLRYAKLQTPGSSGNDAGLASANQDAHQNELLASITPSAACPRLIQPLPMALFDAVKTLSIETYNRRLDRSYMNIASNPLILEQVQYLYHAFPALKKIVYNAAMFPCNITARDWLRNSPRQIEVVHRSRASIEAAALGQIAVV
ncbi:hypothetical protein BGZ68_005527 [Mortierella alpina]|nr:hypothetical protein BGZ68_005527 [Mortierella alpina]